MEGQPPADARVEPYFKAFEVKSVEGSTFRGSFYDTEFSDGRINREWGAIRFAFVTADNSGEYHHSGTLRAGRIEGMSHSIGRKFLNAWTAERERTTTVDARVGAVYAAARGSWRGTLQYRDYSNDRRVTLPTTLDARPSPDGGSLALAFRYDEGNGRTETGSDILTLDRASNTLLWESGGGKSRSEYAVAGLDEFDAARGGRLLLTGPAVENDVTVEARLTMTLDRASLKILKETRPPGGEFQFRNEYTFSRADPTAPAAAAK